MNIKIGGVQYKVNYTDDLRDESGKRVSGTFHGDQSGIYVATDISKQKQYQVLIHEIMHGIISHFNIEDDEHITHKVANGVYAFIVDNATFVKGLIKHDEKLRKKGNSI